MPHLIHPRRQSRLDIELDLMPTDRIFQRWARSVGNEVASQGWGEERSQATPLPEDAAVAVDQAICGTSGKVRKFLHAWYRGQDASATIAQRFGMSRDEVYLYWRAVLWAFRDRFLAMPSVSPLMERHAEGISRLHSCAA
jgi:hypothetical protein